jgi:predicted HNH restriction endonuclease
MDGDPFNNTMTNLLTLCPSCHRHLERLKARP